MSSSDNVIDDPHVADVAIVAGKSLAGGQLGHRRQIAIGAVCGG
ncbi:hypothetical protein [Mycolicibacterium neworleansense]|nr:hypothetical protein [Mycolicibacterium neworleansense]